MVDASPVRTDGDRAPTDLVGDQLIVPPYDLTIMRKEFAEHYVRTLNASRACELAKYKGGRDTWKAMGWKLLQNHKVKAYVAALFNARSMTDEEITGRLEDHARGDIDNFLSLVKNDDGKMELILDWDKAVKANLTHLVKKVVTSRTGKVIGIELYDAQYALERLAKVRGLYSDASEVKVGVQVLVGNIDLDKI